MYTSISIYEDRRAPHLLLVGVEQILQDDAERRDAYRMRLNCSLLGDCFTGARAKSPPMMRMREYTCAGISTPAEESSEK